MPRRKALLIGINYFGTKYQLNGCINDAMNMREYLVRDRGFSSSHHDMVIMTDAPENRGTPFEPTGANMMAVSTFSPPFNIISTDRRFYRLSSGWFLATFLVILSFCRTRATEVSCITASTSKVDLI
jgi:hypothetical protein